MSLCQPAAKKLLFIKSCILLENDSKNLVIEAEWEPSATNNPILLWLDAIAKVQPQICETHVLSDKRL
jgi:hypothetical protein